MTTSPLWICRKGHIFRMPGLISFAGTGVVDVGGNNTLDRCPVAGCTAGARTLAGDYKLLEHGAHLLLKENPDVIARVLDLLRAAQANPATAADTLRAIAREVPQLDVLGRLASQKGMAVLSVVAILIALLQLLQPQLTKSDMREAVSAALRDHQAQSSAPVAPTPSSDSTAAPRPQPEQTIDQAPTPTEMSPRKKTKRKKSRWRRRIPK